MRHHDRSVDGANRWRAPKVGQIAVMTGIRGIERHHESHLVCAHGNIPH
jgi:hypothetical protein